jgi:site-specific recombinase XerD
MAARLRYLRAKLGLGKPVTAYSFRHKFITDALLSGMSTAVVAELVGHGSTAMITSHYSHLLQHPVEMRDLLGGFRK